MIKRLIVTLSILVCALSALFAGQRIIKVSGDEQFGIAGFPLSSDLVVQVLSEKNVPLAGVPVSFVLIEQPAQPQTAKRHSEGSLSSYLVLTDSSGYASTRLNMGFPGTGHVIVSASAQGTIGDPAIFTAVSHKRNWILVLVLECIAGLGLFLFGMFYLNDSLKKIVGEKLKGILITLTGSPSKGLLTGFGVTLLNQASSATTVLEVSLVNAGLLTFYQSMAVTMGAEIGSTMTAQFVAFNLSSYAILIIGMGFFLSFFSNNKKRKNIGDMIIGIGIIFLGMKIMSDIIMPIRSYGPFLDIMKSLENPIYGILAGLIFTAFVRSSGVTAGIVIALAMSGAVNLQQAVPVLLGSGIGTTFTALMVAAGRGREGERVAVWHLVHQLAGVIIVLPLLVFFKTGGEQFWIHAVKKITGGMFLTNDLSRQIAVSQTLTAVLNALIFFPLVGLASKLLLIIMPPKEEEKPFGPMYIDDEFIHTPTIAMEQAKKEIIREGEIVLDMMENTLAVILRQDLRLWETISLKEMYADKLRNSVVPYLTRIGQGGLSEELSKQETQLLFIADDFESIGDIIDKNILPMIRKKLEEKLWFSDEGWNDIVEFHTKVSENLIRALDALKTNNLDAANLIVINKPEIDHLRTELHKRHISRLHSGVHESLETSGMHLDLIDHMRSINSHITSICNSILGNI
jgi:phosphate:Na+ symporter